MASEKYVSVDNRFVMAAFIYITRHILYTTAWNRTAKFSLIKQTDMTFARYNELLPKL